MRTAEEIIKERFKFYDPMIIGKDVELSGETVSELINEARIEAIKECAEIAKPDFIGVDKQSILNLIDQIK